MSQPPSREFIDAVERALYMAQHSGDERIEFMAEERRVPVYAMLDVDPMMRQAAGYPPGAVFRGLWAQTWPGYPAAPHGIIWLFEKGIRAMGTQLVQQAYSTLLHEFDHALQRDHVLEALERHAAAAPMADARPRGCNCR